MAKKKVEATKQALVKNISWGSLVFPEFTLKRGETKQVDYTRKLRDYTAQKLIKILKIF